jgi:SAM-dependent methyltransferase
VEDEDSSSNDGLSERRVTTLYDGVAPMYEKIYLKSSKYYKHLYGALYDVFKEYFNGVKIRSKVLDLGSGTGIWSKLLRLRGYHVISLDISRASLSRCINIGRCSDPVQGDAVRLPFRDEYFDAVIAYGSVFNHIIKAEDAFKDVARVLMRDGYLIFDIDNLLCMDMAYEAMLGGVSMKDFLMGLLDGKGRIGYWYTHDEAIPYRFFTFKEIAGILSRYGFKIVDMRGIHVLSNIVPSRLHQWGDGGIKRFASLLYELDRILGIRTPLKYLATSFLVISRKT